MKKVAATFLLLISSVANSCETYTDKFHLKQSQTASQIAVVKTLEDPKSGKLVVLEVFRGNLIAGQKMQIDVEGIDLKAKTAYLVYSSDRSIKKLGCANTVLAEDEFGHDAPIVIEVAHRESS
ncbi:hypothetical protein [Microbulbifer sp. SAOS-129_SWC]|uniref:hypothetical protein n=1 Tax=Microbulbifer sp. SAOS-129_SWC TaxID=3145235 RepID=UPI00321776F3